MKKHSNATNSTDVMIVFRKFMILINVFRFSIKVIAFSNSNLLLVKNLFQEKHIDVTYVTDITIVVKKITSVVNVFRFLNQGYRISKTETFS